MGEWVRGLVGGGGWVGVPYLATVRLPALLGPTIRPHCIERGWGFVSLWVERMDERVKVGREGVSRE